MENYPLLFSDARLGRLELANRLVVSPMTRTSATEDGLATPPMADYYKKFAQGGFGLVSTEATYIDTRHSQGYLNQPGIADATQAQAWRKVVDAVHAAGAKIMMQLIHGGALIQHNFWTQGSIAPSAVRPVGEQAGRYAGAGKFPVPREITRAEMREIVASFAAAARRAVSGRR